MMTTEYLNKRIFTCEEMISEYEEKMEILKSEIERKREIMENINFDFENLYEINREISDNYYDLMRFERRIKTYNEEIEFCYEKLENSLSQEEIEEKRKRDNIENMKNLSGDLKEIKENFENKFDEISVGENKLIFKKSRFKIEIQKLIDNSYQYINGNRQINVKRKSTVIKYINESLIKMA